MRATATARVVTNSLLSEYEPVRLCPLQSRPARSARPPWCMPLLRYTSRCGRRMSAVSRYGAIDRQNLGAAVDAGVVNHRLHPAELIDLVGHGPCLVQVGQVPTTADAPRSMRSLTAASRSAVRAWTMTSCPPPSRVCAAARPSPPAEPVMKMRATCLLLASLASSAYGASPALFGAVGIGRGQGPCRGWGAQVEASCDRLSAAQLATSLAVLHRTGAESHHHVHVLQQIACPPGRKGPLWLHGREGIPTRQDLS